MVLIFQVMQGPFHGDLRLLYHVITVTLALFWILCLK